MKEELEEFRVAISRETYKAFLLTNVTEPDKIPDEAWFPKSQVEWKTLNKSRTFGVAKLPIWLVKKKGW